MFSQSLNTTFESAYEVYTDKTQKQVERVVCLRCGRPLTNEKSRLARLGPKCARKLAYETRTHSFSPKTLKSYQSLLKSSTPEIVVPIQDISLYYASSSPHKPYCKVGMVILPATDVCTTDEYNCRKKTYSLPLLNGVLYEIGVCLPQVRVFLLQVQDHQLKDVSSPLSTL